MPPQILSTREKKKEKQNEKRRILIKENKGKTWKEIEKENENEKTMKKWTREKKWTNGVPPETAQKKNDFLHKSFNRTS